MRSGQFAQGANSKRQGIFVAAWVGQSPHPRSIERLLLGLLADLLVCPTQRAFGIAVLFAGLDDLGCGPGSVGEFASQPIGGLAPFGTATTTAVRGPHLGSEGVVGMHANWIGFPKDATLFDAARQTIRVLGQVELGGQEQSALRIVRVLDDGPHRPRCGREGERAHRAVNRLGPSRLTQVSDGDDGEVVATGQFRQRGEQAAHFGVVV